MSEFNNVTEIKKANVYFDSKVSSRTIRFSDGSEKTLGFMLPGEYQFNIAAKENMEIIAGDVDVLLPDENSWQTVKTGESFEVPENAQFKVKVKILCDYCCSFIA